jgi:hypothetical protein
VLNPATDRAIDHEVAAATPQLVMSLQQLAGRDAQRTVYGWYSPPLCHKPSRPVRANNGRMSFGTETGRRNDFAFRKTNEGLDGVGLTQ